MPKNPKFEFEMDAIYTVPNIFHASELRVDPDEELQYKGTGGGLLHEFLRLSARQGAPDKEKYLRIVKDGAFEGYFVAKRPKQ